MPQLVEILTKKGIQPGTHRIRPAIIDKPGYDVPMHTSPLSFLDAPVITSVKVFRILKSILDVGLGKQLQRSAGNIYCNKGQRVIMWRLLNLNLNYQLSVFPLASSSANI